MHTLVTGLYYLAIPFHQSPCTILAQGKFSEAELLYKQSLGILEKMLGTENLDVAAILSNMAGLLEKQVRGFIIFHV